MKALPDVFTTFILLMVLLASIFPAQGVGLELMQHLTVIVIAVLFFMHGAKLSRESVLKGITHWKLHLLVFSITFMLFPILGWLAKPLLLQWLPYELYQGWMFMCVVPATVQSAIAFTAIARGNLAAAVCSASTSSLLGVFITPLLVNIWILQASGILNWSTIASIASQILLPFMIGQWAHPYLRSWMSAHPKWVGRMDRSSILVVVYVAFSEAVNQHLWDLVSWPSLLILGGACVVFLLLVMGLSTALARLFKFSKEDEITIVFCGSKKSLASGVPLAKVLFVHQSVGLLILPLMIFHQIQLIVSAYLAQRYAQRPLLTDTSE